MEALNNTDPEIHLEAINAAGTWDLKAAWPHVIELINDRNTPKPLKLAAIQAAGSIHAAALPEALLDLVDSDDEEIAEAAEEAMMMADADKNAGEEDDEDGDWIN